MKSKGHWKRMKQMWSDVGSELGAKLIAYPIMVLLISFIYYFCFTMMYTLFEVGLFIFKRDMFRVNMSKTYQKMIVVC